MTSIQKNEDRKKKYINTAKIKQPLSSFPEVVITPPPSRNIETTKEQYPPSKAIHSDRRFFPLRFFSSGSSIVTIICKTKHRIDIPKHMNVTIPIYSPNFPIPTFL